ncbi:BTAD domain-containing putative transcriptional regulator [Actinomadura rubrisoli]|uniref:BTAD domain-containing putative transcriptional regulator n=1 Tax=Actinomadura rubrisoli TaxID=2530368 RepID=UPI001404F423|nr:BTAD domain-containing putative transcriptional regulator [Actinomadura rubrisoli]
MLVVRVLGPTRVTSDGMAVDLGGPQSRRLLARLVLADGRPVTDDGLVEAVWGDEAPARAVSSLQVYVSRLRRQLGAHRGLLERSGSGYRFVVPPESVDTVQFGRDLDLGRRFLADNAASEALDALTTALAHWQGDAYADLLDTAEVVAARGHLTELRETAVEEQLAARLAAGDAPKAVAELEEATRAAPYRERRWALLVLGLYRCGRQADALAVLRKVRALLADELGVDPGPELQRLERLVLAQDPQLMFPTTSADASPRNLPMTSADASPRNLPTPFARSGLGRPLSSFRGRDAELGQLTRILAEQRLVTLIGPAGVGKTRLAVEYAAARPDGDGPWLVRLADVREPEVVAQAIADAIGLAQVVHDPRLALIGVLAHRPGLLILDNCEHLVDAVAALAIELITACPRLRVLTTSREPLRVDGEITLAVEPLPVAAADGSDGAALSLLFDRIATVRPGWTPSAAEREHARRVCTALDGIPLALELAAARTQLLGLGEIAQHLGDRFALLGSVPRGSLTHHATLDAAIAWSVEPLPAADRALLLRLWPFEGGFSLEAATAVRPDGTRQATTFESLASLVSRSVVSADTTVTPTRYRLLETIRAYCQACDPEPAATQEAHAHWVRDLVDRCAVQLYGVEAGPAIRTILRELPNLRAGIAHDLRHRPEMALRMVGLLDWFWIRRGHVAEGKRLLDAALRAATDASDTDRARAHLAGMSIGFLIEDSVEAERRCHEEILPALGDRAEPEQRLLYGMLHIYAAMWWLGIGDIDASHDAASTAIAIGTDLGDDWLTVSGRMINAATLIRRGQPEAGEAGLLQAAAQALAAGLSWPAGWSELALAQSYLLRHQASAEAQGRTAAALDALRRAHMRFQHEEDMTYMIAVLDTAASALALADRPHDAIRLRAAVQHHARRLGVRPDLLSRFNAPQLDTLLTERERASAEADGTRMSWTDMVDLIKV